MRLQGDICDMTVNLSFFFFLLFYISQSGKIISDMKVPTKKWSDIDEKKMLPIDIHRCLVNVYENETANSRTVRRREMFWICGKNNC